MADSDYTNLEENLEYLNTDKFKKRFWVKVAIKDSNECWNWIAGKFTAGYGAILIGGIPAYAHRVSYRLHYGQIPHKLVVRHKCDNPSCVNPNHLELGTHYDNVMDMVHRGRSGIKAETKLKISAALKGGTNKNNKRFILEGKEFRTLLEASLFYNVSHTTIKNRIISGKGYYI